MENLRVVFVMICRFVGEQMSLIFTRRAQNSDVDKIVQILQDAISFFKGKWLIAVAKWLS